MKSLEQLYSDLKALSTEFEKLLAAKSEACDQRENFAAIRELAEKVPVENPTLMGLDGHRQGEYLRLLCTAAALDGAMSAEQLLYLSRLAIGAGHEADPKDLTVMAYQTDYLDWRAVALDLKKAALPLMLDIMIAVHLAERTPDQGLAFAAELAALLEVEAEDVEVCAQLAAALLTQNFEAFKTIRAGRSYSKLGYAVPKEWLEQCKVKCGRYMVFETKRAERR